MGRIRATAVLHKSCLFVLCFLASELSCAQAGRSGTSDNSIDLRDVSSLTFRSGQMTKGRRAAPVPQLACTGGKACGTHSYMVDVVQCRNVGEDDMGSVQVWFPLHFRVVSRFCVLTSSVVASVGVPC